MATILSNPLFTGYILPFVLIFTVVFAVLQKSKILGDGKKQIDALVALVIGLIVVSFANAVGIINSLLPFLAVSIVIILVFFILVSLFFYDKEKGVAIPDGLKNTAVTLIVVSVVVAVLVVTGAWDYLAARFYGDGDSSTISNIIFIAIIIGAVIFALKGDKKDDKNKS